MRAVRAVVQVLRDGADVVHGQGAVKVLVDPLELGLRAAAGSAVVVSIALGIGHGQSFCFSSVVRWAARALAADLVSAAALCVAEDLRRPPLVVSIPRSAA